MNIDAEILTALRCSGAGSLSGADLAQRLGVSRAAVWARIEDLRALGYEITASPHGGYRLLSTPDVLHADDLLSRLGKTRVIGRDIRVFRETTSTNDIIEKLARDGVREGVVVFAESQTKGRGRLGRRWVSPRGAGLWFSILLRPVLRPQEATQLTIMAATALARAIREQTDFTPEVKWPNDILVGGRKVAGILTELTAELDRVRHVVLGIGLDVNQAAGDFPPDLRRIATSLRAEAGRIFDRAELAVTVLRALDRDYLRLREGQFDGLAAEWEDLCTTLGRDVTILLGSRRVRGRAESLDSEGALLVRTEHGRLERMTGGDVTLAK
ncbi:MAG TPA: biotin--[acetyl-CoA-carboxylase] ligase [Verrucomicrobiota bacterium]|nr:biotin--[acetyl-CoA-carboxylase] ligase [Verrucomicrobiota bacterium]